MDLERHIAERVAVALPQGASVCAGLSGGLDSVVLVELLARAAGRRPFRLSAVHVHHGISPNADAWASFCESFCEARAIPISIERVRVERCAREGLEAAARKARYAVFGSRTEDLVALAHHLDDQAETVLLQIVRGTGLKGAAAMPELRALAPRVRIFRPLLDVPRAALEAFARREGLAWVEDESNARHAHGRNFLRHEVAPRLDARFPGWRRSAQRFARHAASADALLQALAVIDGLPASRDEPLRLEPRLAPERRANLLREYLALNEVPLPSEARLQEISRQLFEARPEARVRIDHAGVALVRYRHALSLDRGGAAGEPWHRPWQGELQVDLGRDLGHVRFAESTGEGLGTARIAEGGWHFAGRAGGERMRTHPRRPTRSLKNLLQEHAIPPWERPRLPLLFHRDALVWVPGIGIAVDYACAPGEPGLVPHWSGPG